MNKYTIASIIHLIAYVTLAIVCGSYEYERSSFWILLGCISVVDITSWLQGLWQSEKYN